MNKHNLRKFSLINAVIGVVVLLIAYFFFHFVTDSGITLKWNEEAGKPFVTNLIGTFGVLFLWSSLTSFIASFVFFNKNNK